MEERPNEYQLCMCNKCGFVVMSEPVQSVKQSYIDPSIIGKDPKSLDWYSFDENKDQEILPKGSIW